MCFCFHESEFQNRCKNERHYWQFDESKKKRKQWCKKKEEAKKVKAAQDNKGKDWEERQEEARGIEAGGKETKKLRKIAVSAFKSQPWIARIRKEKRDEDEEEDQPLQSCPYCGAELVTNIHIRAWGKF